MQRALALTSVVLVSLAAQAAHTQTPLSFEVASVRLNTAFPPMGSGAQIRPEQFEATQYPLEALIALAYGVGGGRIEGAPEWVKTERYDIRAKAPKPSSRQEILQMLQTFFAERFRLKVRRETRTIDIYGLIVAKPDALGAGMHPVKVDCETNTITEGPDPRIFPEARPPCGSASVQLVMAAGPVPTTVRHAAVTMEKLAAGLSGVGRPVFDRTGVTGTFDVELKYIREMPSSPFIGSPLKEPPLGVSLRDAIKQQLGLDLRSERGPVEFLVVDSIQRPDAN